MYTQERAHQVIWNWRHRAETTDVVQTEDGNDFEGGEKEERPTADPVVNPSSHVTPGQLESLLERMRRTRIWRLGVNLGQGPIKFKVLLQQFWMQRPAVNQKVCQ